MKIKREDVFVWLFMLVSGIMVFQFDASVPDYSPYRGLYENSQNVGYEGLGVEPLYLLLCKICSRIGWSYNIFLAVFVMTGIMILWNSLSKYADNRYWVLFAYMVFPFYTDTIQIRNFMAYAIVIYGCRFLIEERGWKRVMKFLLSIVVACGFHFIALVYVSLLATLVDREKLRVLVPAGMAAVLALAAGSTFFQSMIMSVEKYRVYFQGNNLLSMNLKNAVFTALFVLMNYIMVRIILKRKQTVTSFDEWFEKVNDISLIYLVIIILFGNNFYRIYRNLIPLYYIELSTFSHNNTETESRIQNDRILDLLKFNYPVIFEMAFGLNELLKRMTG